MALQGQHAGVAQKIAIAAAVWFVPRPFPFVDEHEEKLAFRHAGGGFFQAVRCQLAQVFADSVPGAVGGVDAHLRPRKFGRPGHVHHTAVAGLLANAVRHRGLATGHQTQQGCRHQGQRDATPEWKCEQLAHGGMRGVLGMGVAIKAAVRRSNCTIGVVPSRRCRD